MVTDSATTRDTLEALRRALEDAPQLGSVETYATQSIDWAGVDSRALFPIVEFVVVSESKSDYSLVEYVQNDAGETVGELYERVTTLRVQISIHVLSGTQHNHIDLGDELDVALARYASDGYGDLFVDDTGEGIDAIKLRRVENGRATSSTGQSGGSIRMYTWSQDVICDVTQRLNTVEEYGPQTPIADVLVPADGDYSGTPTEDELRAQPPYDN